MKQQANADSTSIRLDLWLDIACLFKTRSEAQKACKNGKIDVNGQTAKPHREIRVGDEILVSRPLGRRQRIVVRGLADKHLPKSEARELYEDLTPPPSPQEIVLQVAPLPTYVVTIPSGAMRRTRLIVYSET